MTIDNVLEILEKHKLYIPSNVFYELKADIVNFEEPTTKNDLEGDCISRADARKAIIDHQYSDSFCEEHSIDHSINTGMALIALSDLPPINKKCVDCISRKAVLDMAKSYNTDGWDMYTPLVVDVEDIEELPSVTPQEPRCRECKWWKDSDGAFRRGIGAESQCPINTHAVYSGEGYCYKFSPKADMREVEE